MLPDDIPTDPKAGIHMIVSSKHMIMASTFFKDTLISGISVVFLHESKAPAFEILLRIIHNQNKLVPRKLGVSELLHIVSAIKLYKLHESTELFADIWARILLMELNERTLLPTQSNDLSLLTLAYFFDNSALRLRELGRAGYHLTRDMRKGPGVPPRLKIVLGMYLGSHLLNLCPSLAETCTLSSNLLYTE